MLSSPPKVPMKLDTMTVGELKAYLDGFPDERPVAFAFPSGDYWRTRLVGQIKSPEYVTVTYSEYHQQFQVKADEDTDEDTEGDDGAQEVLILG